MDDVISKFKILNIYKESLEKPKMAVVSNIHGNVMGVHANDKHTVSTTMLHTEQKWDIMCKNLASQLHNSKKVAIYQL